MANKILTFLSPVGKYCTRKNFTFLAIVFGVFFLSGCGGTPSAGPTGAGSGRDIGIQIIHGAMQLAGAMLGILTALVTLLIHPGWYNGEFFSMQSYFKAIWVLMSNVVYFIFAFILIWIAFMNIIGKAEGNSFELKKALPKFVVGILMVPFSWFFVQFILSISSLLMVAMLSLPQDSFKEFGLFENSTDEICSSFTINLGTPLSTPSGSATRAAEWFICDPGTPKTSIQKIFSAEGSVYGLVGAYTYGILKLDRLNSVTTEMTTNNVKTITDLLLKTIFDLIFIVVYWILMMALFIALFVRGVWIWLYIMLSPLFGLLYFFDKDDMLGDFKEFNLTKFIGLALVPVYVGAALSFGLIFILVVNKGMASQVIDGGKKLITCDATGSSCLIEIADFKFTVKGAVGAGVGVASGAAQIGSGAIGSIIVNLFGIAVLWMAVMAALNASEITKSAIGPIHEFGNQMGKLALQAPQYMPILPGGLSARGLGEVGQAAQSHVQRGSSDRAQQFIRNNTPFDSSHAQTLHNIEDATRRIRAQQGSAEDNIRTMLSSAGTLRDVPAMRRATQFHDMIRAVAARPEINVDLTGINLGTEQGILEALRKIQTTAAGSRVLGNAPLSLRDVEEMARSGSITSSSSAVPPQAVALNLPGVSAAMNLNITTNAAGVRTIQGITGIPASTVVSLDGTGSGTPELVNHLATAIPPGTSKAALRTEFKRAFNFNDAQANVLIAQIEALYTSAATGTPLHGRTLNP